MLCLCYPDLSGHVLDTALGCDLHVPNPSLSQCLFLNSISRCGSSLVVAVSLVLNGYNRVAVRETMRRIHALAVDCAVGPRIGGGKNLTQAYSRHHTPLEVRSVDCPFGGVQNVSLRP